MKDMLEIKTVPCRITSCSHKPFKGRYAIQAETMHYHRAHSGKIKVKKEGEGNHKKRRTQAVARFDLHNGRAKLNGVTVDKMDKRTKAWRDAHPRQAKPTGFQSGSAFFDGNGKRQKDRPRKLAVHTVQMNWCPNCLTNLLAVASGLLRAGQGHLQVTGCPVCGCNVRVVAEEIASVKHNARNHK